MRCQANRQMLDRVSIQMLSKTRRQKEKIKTKMLRHNLHIFDNTC